MQLLGFLVLLFVGNVEAQTKLTGNVRWMYEYVNAFDFDKAVTDPNGYLFQRVHLGLASRWSAKTASFVEAKSSAVFDKSAGNIPLDKDEFDVSQLYVEHQLPTITLKVGRQELNYGSLRLISAREGPNSRLSFDMAKLVHKFDLGELDVFLGAPVEIERYSLNNSPEKDQLLWGSYLTLKRGLDLYYLGLSKPSFYGQRPGHETRHSLGSRLWGKVGNFDYNHEVVVQGGEFDQDEIRAWTIATETGWNLPARLDRLRFGFRADMATGDSDPTDRRLETFNALYPKGNYFGFSGVLGPSNFIDLHPSASFYPREKILVKASTNFYWRESNQDGIYGPNGRQLRAGNANARYFVGTQYSLETCHEEVFAKHASACGELAHFQRGAYLTAIPGTRDINFLNLWLKVKI